MPLPVGGINERQHPPTPTQEPDMQIIRTAVWTTGRDCGPTTQTIRATLRSDGRIYFTDEARNISGSFESLAHILSEHLGTVSGDQIHREVMHCYDAGKYRAEPDGWSNVETSTEAEATAKPGPSAPTVARRRPQQPALDLD
jgi:hypothetical protein